MNRLRQWLSRRRPASLRSARLEMVVQHADAIDSSEARSFWARLLRGTAFLDASAEEQSEILRYAGQCYLRYYRDTDDARFLDEAVALLVSAVTCLPLPAPQTIAALNTCGLAYRARYAHHGDLADLDRACDQFRQAADQEANRTTRSDYLANLAAARRSYYEHTGDPAILREALTVAEEALRLVPASSADRGSKLNLYANVLYAWFGLVARQEGIAQTVQEPCSRRGIIRKANQRLSMGVNSGFDVCLVASLGKTLPQHLTKVVEEERAS